MRRRKDILCKLGFHSIDKEHLHVDRDWRRYSHIMGRYAFCKRCWKKLYRTDKYGRRIKKKKEV